AIGLPSHLLEDRPVVAAFVFVMISNLLASWLTLNRPLPILPMIILPPGVSSGSASLTDPMAYAMLLLGR
ncbi:hypothetical protein, partial [Citrobacter youngae]|uniref:hypothetical protein n=1 Tax=Citrobacter youngae TaxID=133448 RepID=UPI00195490E7